MEQSDPRQAFSIRAAARAYGLSPDTLRQAIQGGELPASRLGERAVTILRADLERWIRGHALQPTTPARRHAARVVGTKLGLEDGPR